MDGPKYRAFLSYSHRDAKWGAWLHKSIESYRPPKRLVGKPTPRGSVPKRLSPIFRDREELASATDLNTVINEALRQSECQIVICSPPAARSRWVNEEILAFKRLGREDRIFCLIVDGEPNASDDPTRTHEECFPPALRFRLGVDGNLSDARTEPIAADARPGKDGKSHAKLKLIAGLLGVGFNELKQREQQRRQRQLLAITSAALAGMTLTTGLAVIAMKARSTAERERARAEAEAETAKQTTNFLVDLFRISDPSEARGNTVTAREMLDKGAARIDAELASQPGVQATLMDTVGTVYMGLGLYGAAEPLLDRAVARRRGLNDDRSMLSESLNHLADLRMLQARYTQAEQDYREAIAKESAKPTSALSQTTLAKSFYGIGIVLKQQGRFEEAEKYVRDALALQRQLYGDTHADIARTLKDLAMIMDQRGDLKGALPLMKDAVAMQRHLHGTLPDPALAEAINDLGLLFHESGDYDSSQQAFQEAIAMKRRLLGDKHPEIAAGMSNLAYVLNGKGDFAGAEVIYREVLAMQRELLGEMHPDVANTLNNLAFVQYDRGNRQEAMRTERQALEIYRQLFPNDHPEVARVMNSIAYWLTETGEYADAERDIRESLAMRRRLLGESHPDIASSLTHLAILQVATGNFRDALESAHTAVEIYTSTLSATHWATALAESAEGAALSGLKRYPEAERLLTQGYELLSKDIDAMPMYRTLAQRYLDQLHRRWRRSDDMHASGKGPTATMTLASSEE